MNAAKKKSVGWREAVNEENRDADVNGTRGRELDARGRGGMDVNAFRLL